MVLYNIIYRTGISNSGCINSCIPARRAYEDIYIQFRDYQIPGAYCLWMVANCSSVYKLFHLIFPLLISIPYTYTIYNDVKSNYIYNIACRISKKKYYMSKLITQFVVGTVVVAFCLLSSFILQRQYSH